MRISLTAEFNPPTEVRISNPDFNLEVSIDHKKYRTLAELDYIPKDSAKMECSKIFNYSTTHIEKALSEGVVLIFKGSTRLWIPRSPESSSRIISMYDSNESILGTIELDASDCLNDNFILLSVDDSVLDTDALSAHEKGSTPHIDTIVGVSYNSNLMLFRKEYIHKLKMNSDVVSDTYIERNGRFRFLGGMIGGN